MSKLDDATAGLVNAEPSLEDAEYELDRARDHLEMAERAFEDIAELLRRGAKRETDEYDDLVILGDDVVSVSGAKHHLEWVDEALEGAKEEIKGVQTKLRMFARQKKRLLQIVEKIENETRAALDAQKEIMAALSARRRHLEKWENEQ